jgi:hypothetical protein
MGDSVKVTVIATGFPQAEEKSEPAVTPRPSAEFFAERTPERPAAPEPAPEPMPVAAAQVFEEELDVPAYLRQGKLLN